MATLAKFIRIGQFFEGLFCIGQYFENWANYVCCIRLNIEK